MARWVCANDPLSTRARARLSCSSTVASLMSGNFSWKKPESRGRAALRLTPAAPTPPRGIPRSGAIETRREVGVLGHDVQVFATRNLGEEALPVNRVAD